MADPLRCRSLTDCQRSEWATPTDWDTCRELITRLYIDKGKPLKEVIEIMKMEYAFHGTVKMYKMRFKQWGLRKHLTSSERKEVFDRVARGADARLPVIRGRQLGAKRLLDQVSRMGAVRSAFLRTISSPDGFKSVESSILAVSHWAKGRTETDFFGISDDDYRWIHDTALYVQLDVQLATDMMSPDMDMTISFHLLNRAFSRYTRALYAAEASLVCVSLVIMLSLAAQAEDLANTFTRYAAALSAIKLGSEHPISRLWSRLESMSIQDCREAIPLILDAYFAAIKSTHRSGELFRKVSVMNAACSLFKHGLVSFESASSLCLATTEELYPISTKDVISNRCYWRSRLIYCRLLYRAGMYDASNQALASIGAYLYNDCPDFTYDNMRTDLPPEPYYMLKASVLEQLGLHGEAERYYVEACKACDVAETPGLKTSLLHASVNLEKFYLRRGKAQSAKRAREGVTKHLRPLLQAEETQQEIEYLDD